ncbi:AAA domain-containing protein [Hygrophoropsis aurantiaca]|uniref:AAA domain-containing protein n=1 Tax=Hygrophoropsis aurantiaca TaxID=72124 RepID=A0ACB8ARN3_9AGAM|nr:AAA domain-containing protein [Hygrophoropsis aurantiaca]
MASKRRLAHVAQSLASPRPVIGTLKLGEIQYEVSEALTPTRLPHCAEMGLLDTSHPFNADNLHFMLQKYLLGQDVFLVSQPGPYARRLAMTFASIINAEYEYLALHRDVGETELKQGREIRSGGNLVYVDSAAVRAAKHGRLLILEGIEKAERGIMPVLNNLLENREMNLDDGSLIVHPQKYAQLEAERPPLVNGKVFIPAHKAFRVIAIAAPVPPYPGYPLDPPFRSRFQARFIDPVGALLALSNSSPSASTAPPFFQKIRDIILSTQYASENRHALESISKSTLPPFPQTALAKLKSLTEKFPPPSVLSSGQLARVFLVLHPALAHAPFQAWAMLSRQSEEAELGELGSPATSDSNEDIGIFGYRITNIVRISEWRVRLTFDCPSGRNLVVVDVPAGRNPIRPFPFQGKPEFQVTKRFLGLLTCLLQGHALGKDISLIPPVSPSTASCSTSTLLRVFSEVLGYDMEAVHVYKELGGREIIMRRNIEESGATSWQPSPLVSGAYSGKLVHLDGLDVSGATGGSLARFMQDREIELWEGKRIVGTATEQETTVGELSVAHPSLRIVTTASKSLPLKDWLSDEHANMFFPIPSQPMDEVEEEAILLQTGCLSSITQSLLSFAGRYRSSIASDEIQRNRKLGTRALVRIAKLFAKFPRSIDLHAVLSRTLLADFLPAVEKINLNALLLESGILKSSPAFNPSPNVEGSKLIFPESNSSSNSNSSFELISIPLFDAAEDREGVASHVPHMDHFYDNSLQTGLMRDLAIDIEVLGEHVVLLGNQGVGKNKIVDRICQLLGRPREYIQLHRDSTVNQLIFTTSLEGGVIKYTDSPLLRAITHGRIILIDEADKAPEHVVAIFRSLASHGEMTLSDGRRVRAVRERPDDIVVHPNFRLVLLANRPGYPFLGNHFLQVLGDNFSCHAISNPDQASERKLLSQLAPEIDEDILLRLVGAFQDLRQGYDSGTLTYPYSLRELINLVRHMQSFPTDSLSTVLRNVFDFDIYKTDTIDKLAEFLRHHGLNAEKLGLDAARETAEKKILDLKFEPTDSTGLKEPKEGEHDARYNPHVGGNRWAGGSGGRDTAGSGGRGGYKRLQKGHSIHQVSDQLKDEVPEHIKKHAREMAREEFLRRLEELDISVPEAAGYGELLTGVQAHIASLHDLLEHLAAKEEERVWFKRQTDGELDDSRLTEGLTGEQSVYKRRGMEKPELGRPQIKPKRIRFIFDISGSMYRFQHDGRLKRSLETAVMLMESFERVSRKDKYTWDMYGHSGDEPLIPLVDAGKYPVNVRDRWKVVEKMHLVTQYAFSGDYTVEAIDKGVAEVAKFDADDWFVVAITDANFGRYQITPDEVKRVMLQNPKVHTALICIGEGAEVPWITKELPGRAFRVFNTTDIPIVLRSILSTMIDR